MESIIEKQEEIITQLQLAIEHYLEKGDLETALVYSELFKLNCEAYKSLVCNKEAKEEKPVFRFGKGNPQAISQKQTPVITSEKARQNYEAKMLNEYLQQLPQVAVVNKVQSYQEPKTIVSQYSYGDGQDNPKIRANDINGNWGKNGEPNQIITPPQQLINNPRIANTEMSEEDNLWGEDPRRSLNKR
jgi:hypothetical protein